MSNDPPSAPVIGIDLGGTNMQVGVVGADGHIAAHVRRKTQAEKGLDHVLDRIEEAVRDGCEHVGIEAPKLVGLGIGAPGAIEPSEGRVLEAVNLRWTDVPLAELLKKRLGVPIVVDNDVNVGLYGEFKQGAAREASDVLGVWVGTGIGGGLIFDGRLFHGAMYTAGEIGHTTLFPNAPFGFRSLEQNCSRTSVVNRLESLVRANEPSSLLEQVQSGKAIRSKAIAKAYAEGDDLTRRVIDEAAQLLGTAIAGAVTLLSIPTVILGGGLTEAVGTPFVTRVEESVRRHVFPDRLRCVKVLASELQDDAGIVGAAALARERLTR